jgi:hypothetical protein
MLAMGGRIDGVVYHPYDKGDAMAESVYEPPYYDYLTWVNPVKTATKLPIWETEWAIDRGRSEDQSAIFDCRRLTMALCSESSTRSFTIFAILTPAGPSSIITILFARTILLLIECFRFLLLTSWRMSM